MHDTIKRGRLGKGLTDSLGGAGGAEGAAGGKFCTGGAIRLSEAGIRLYLSL